MLIRAGSLPLLVPLMRNGRGNAVEVNQNLIEMASLMMLMLVRIIFMLSAADKLMYKQGLRFQGKLGY